MNTSSENKLMPTLFVSHSNPLKVMDEQISQSYRTWAVNLPKPKAILVFSAHWEESELTIGEVSSHEKLIYDFYGFPDELYSLQYPAPSAAWLAHTIRSLLGGKIHQHERGLDHGVWVPLMRMWPEADVPILQVSLPKNHSNQDLYELGERLFPLREQGVMIVGAGTLTHNQSEGLSGKYTDTPDWVREFDDWVGKTLRDNKEKLIDWETSAPYPRRNHPTPEHFLPLLIVAGAATNNDSPQFPLLGFDMAAFSQRSVQFG